MMNSWDVFEYFTVPAALLWLGGGFLALFSKNRDKTAKLLYSAGILIYLAFVVMFWIQIERVPMRTMGETRMLYSMFLPVVGLFIFHKWRFRWVLLYSAILATVFVVINITKPEIHNTTLPPALQSGWFVPHVTTYMMSYAVLGVTTIIAIISLITKDVAKKIKYAVVADNLVGIGIGLIALGMFFGAFWAKEAWGDYWTWDPKETWAAVTWLSYITYLHCRKAYPSKLTRNNLLLIASFVFLQICWYGINYLPAAAHSVHTYNK